MSNCSCLAKHHLADFAAKEHISHKAGDLPCAQVSPQTVHGKVMGQRAEWRHSVCSAPQGTASRAWVNAGPLSLLNVEALPASVYCYTASCRPLLYFYPVFKLDHHSACVSCTMTLMQTCLHQTAAATSDYCLLHQPGQLLASHMSSSCSLTFVYATRDVSHSISNQVDVGLLVQLGMKAKHQQGSTLFAPMHAW